LHGVNFFGWNTDTPNFDGLWAYNDDEVPGYDSVGDAGALQRLNISWWGKRRIASDFAAVVHRMGLLGFNAVRVQFTFENLNRELPAGAEPEFYPCLVSAAQQRCNRAAAITQVPPGLFESVQGDQLIAAAAHKLCWLI
jgi:hypothetical protein